MRTFLGQCENAIISSTVLGTKDSPVFSALLYLDYGSGCQSFGGYSLDTPSNPKTFCRVGTAWGMEFIARVLKTLDVTSWEKLKGCHIRADHSDRFVFGIGHIIKDQWFYPETDLEFLKGVKP